MQPTNHLSAATRGPGAGPATPTMDIRHTDANCSVVTHGSCFIVIWHNDTELSAVRRLSEIFRGFIDQQPSKVTFLTIVDAGAPVPSSEARTALASFMSQAGERIGASAVIFEGSGFRAAAVRSVVTGLTMLARQGYPHKVFATLTEGIMWINATMRAVHAPELALAASFATGISELRGTLGSHGKPN